MVLAALCEVEVDLERSGLGRRAGARRGGPSPLPPPHQHHDVAITPRKSAGLELAGELGDDIEAPSGGGGLEGTSEGRLDVNDGEGRRGNVAARRLMEARRGVRDDW